MGGCQNYGPLLGPLNTRCRIVLRTQKGTIILITTHMIIESSALFGLRVYWLAQTWPRDARVGTWPSDAKVLRRGLYRDHVGSLLKGH